MANGNLILPPFRAEDYNQEVHAQTYRCLAANTFGKIQSRDVHVRAGNKDDILNFEMSLNMQNDIVEAELTKVNNDYCRSWFKSEGKGH